MERSYKYLLFLFLSYSCLGFAQGTEEQRKYKLSGDFELLQKTLKMGNFDPVQLKHHSEDLYYDIYLDSPDFLLKELGYSLRFRRKHTNDSLITYSFQLKSEMQKEGEIRLEIEEKELEIYQVMIDSVWVGLKTVLDPIFDFTIASVGTVVPEKEITILQEWIRFKSNAPLLPFQALKALEPKTCTPAKVSEFTPVLVGISNRNRFHGVYMTKTSHPAIEMNKIATSTKPEMIRNDPSLNWILEASLDQSKFRSIIHPERYAEFLEFEVENKYYDPEKGRKLLDVFETEATNKIGLTPSKESKYLQALLQIQE